MPTDPKSDLETAYALQTPEQNREVYADWAKSYDGNFASRMDYHLPKMVALIFAKNGLASTTVLDVGAGTGLLAESIPARGLLEIDAIDISPQMLAVAAEKKIYRKTIEADLTKPLDIADATYGAIVSSGTFTHGHVGPEALDELLRIARTGAVFVLAINDAHFEARGFAEKFSALEPLVDGLKFQSVTIYGLGADVEHKDDTARIAVFRKR